MINSLFQQRFSTIRRVSILTILMTIACGLFAAGQAQTEAAGRNGVPAIQPRKVTLMLDWVPNVNHVGIFAARDRGYFAEAGLAVKIIQPGEVYATAAVASGRADFGIDFQESMTMLRAQNVPLVSIAAVLQTNTSGFAVRAEEDIRDPADFEGLKYGTFQSPYEKPTLDTIVGCRGGDPATIEFVPAGTDLLAMLQQEKADLVWIFYGTQGFQARRLGIEIDYFPLNEYTDCIPDYYTPLVIAAEKTLEERPQLVRDFLSALSAAHMFVIENPGEAAEILSAAVPELDAGELRQSVPWLADHMLMGAPEWGHQELSVWEDYSTWMWEQKVLEREIDPAGAFTTEFLPGVTGGGRSAERSE